MSSKIRADRSPPTLAVLSLLAERPRHPYEMQALIRERHVGRVVRMRGGSLYDAVRRLQRVGLIAPLETERAGARPERTIYALTDSGRTELDSLLVEMLSEPLNEYPRFVAALAHVLGVGSKERAEELLRRRAARLRTEMDEIDALRADLPADMPRIVMIETDYAQAMRRAELDWLAGTVEALSSGRLGWIEAEP